MAILTGMTTSTNADALQRAVPSAKTPSATRAVAGIFQSTGFHWVGNGVHVSTYVPSAKLPAERVSTFLRAVYGWMCVGLAITAGTAWIIAGSPALVAELRRSGYEGAVTTCDRPNPTRSGDPYRIPRKVLWDAHTRGPSGHFSPSLSAAHLLDTFGALGLTAPVDGEVAQPEPKLDPQPTEGELAY